MEKLYKIGYELYTYDLLNFCKSGEDFAEELCEDENFWRQKAIMVLGYKEEELPDMDVGWKLWYLEHCGQVYGLGDGEHMCLEAEKYYYKPTFIYSKIKKILCTPEFSFFVDVNDNLYECNKLMLDRKVKVKQIDYDRGNKTYFILTLDGKLHRKYKDKVIYDIFQDEKISYIGIRDKNLYILVDGILLIHAIYDKSINPAGMYVKNIRDNKIKSFKTYREFIVIIDNKNKCYIQYDVKYNSEGNIRNSDLLFIADNVIYFDAFYKSLSKEIKYWIDGDNISYLMAYNSTVKEQKIYELFENTKKIKCNENGIYLLKYGGELYYTKYISYSTHYSNINNWLKIMDNVNDIEAGDLQFLALQFR